MKYKLKVYTIWEYGQCKDADGNPHQEDSLFPLHGLANEDDRLFILCDGMGGHDLGEVASATVCEAMGKSVLASNSAPEGEFTEQEFYTALDAAFKALDEHECSEKKKMGTTMTFLKLCDNGYYIAHIGDSRVYHIRPGRTKETTSIIYQTIDHSLVNDLLKIGELTPEEAKTFKQKNVLTRAMQPNMERRPKADLYHSTNIKAGDYFYLCSDGMLEYMNDNDIKYVFSNNTENDENIVSTLTNSTEGNRDNHSAIIVHILDVEDPIEDENEQTPEIQVVSKKGKRKWIFRNLFSLLLIIIIGCGALYFSNFTKEEYKKEVKEDIKGKSQLNRVIQQKSKVLSESKAP